MPASLLRIAFLGCGNMGRSLLKAWLTKLSPSFNYLIISRNEAKISDLLTEPNIQWIPAGQPLPYDPDVIVIAVKPYQIQLALDPYSSFKECLYITIAAGKTISYYEAFIKNQKILRLMPNLPAVIGQGVIAVYTKCFLSNHHLDYSQSLLQVLGDVEWLQNEEQFHAFTAVAGSGPAYLFLLTESLISAAVKQGLPLQLADTIVKKTMTGSGLYLNTTIEQIDSLRKAVTSPGGTTEAALSVLMKPDQENFITLIDQAVSAAKLRSQELSE